MNKSKDLMHNIMTIVNNGILIIGNLLTVDFRCSLHTHTKDNAVN